MKKTKRLAHELTEGALFYNPDLLDGERRMSFYRRLGGDEVDGRYIRISWLGLMQFRPDGSKRVNMRPKADGRVGLFDRRMPVVELG